jgi:hypothetical protein
MAEENGVVGYRQVIAFLDQSSAFARGFEAGRLYSQMRAGQERIEGHYHVANEEQLINIAQKCGYAMTVRDPVENGWVWMEFERR